MELLKNRKAIEKNGRLNSHIIQSLPIHKYTK